MMTFFKENETAKALGFDNDRLQVGVCAQELEKVLPEVIHSAPVNALKDTDYVTVDYARLTAVLIEAIKEQQVQIDELKEKIYGRFTK